MVGMQANVVLQDLYVKRAHEHLQEHEERKKNKKRSKKLMGDGLPKLLDSDNFFSRVTEHHEAVQREVQHHADRQAQQEEQAAAIVEWKKTETDRKARNDETRLAYQSAIKAWEQERDLAKAERRKSRWNKPKMGAILKPIARPNKPDMVESGLREGVVDKVIDGGETGNSNGDEDDSDSDSEDDSDSDSEPE